MIPQKVAGKSVLSVAVIGKQLLASLDGLDGKDSLDKAIAGVFIRAIDTILKGSCLCSRDTHTLL